MKENGAPSRGHVAALVHAALEEDRAHADATVAFCGLAGKTMSAEIRAGEAMVVAGLAVAHEVFHQVDRNVVFEACVADGDRADAGSVLARLHGPAGAVLAGERTALNFLQRLCGVATHAARFVAAVAGTGVTILDTRKTVPLWRELDKYAVRCGGATNHRRDLHAMVLVKDNHVHAAGGYGAILARIDAEARAPFLELEVDSPAFLDALLASPACDRVDRIMLDNFTPAGVEVAVARIEGWRRARAGRRVEVEVSGGITLETIRSFAVPGVDFISVGAITHSAPAAPLSMDVR